MKKNLSKRLNKSLWNRSICQFHFITTSQLCRKCEITIKPIPRSTSNSVGNSKALGQTCSEEQRRTTFEKRRSWFAILQTLQFRCLGIHFRCVGTGRVLGHQNVKTGFITCDALTIEKKNEKSLNWNRYQSHPFQFQTFFTTFCGKMQRKD